MARASAQRLEVAGQITFLESDLFQRVSGTFQVICSNPPYIKRDDLGKLAPEIAYEPAVALDGGADGLDFTAAFSARPLPLEEPGFVVLEIGWDQAREVRALGKRRA